MTHNLIFIRGENQDNKFGAKLVYFYPVPPAKYTVTPEITNNALNFRVHQRIFLTSACHFYIVLKLESMNSFKVHYNFKLNVNFSFALYSLGKYFSRFL